MNEKGKYIYDWPRPMVTVDAAVFSFFGGKLKLLLIQRKQEPFKGQWALPGGFVGMDEELKDAAARELAEETHLTGVKLEQLHTFGTVGRDPRGRQITVVYTGIAPDDSITVKGGDDAADARWFDLDTPPENLAFDHKEIINCALLRLKKTKVYKDYAAEK